MIDKLQFLKLNVVKWKLIRKALHEYMSTRERQLLNENAGDSEWQEVTDLQDIIRSIDLYIIPPETNK